MSDIETVDQAAALRDILADWAQPPAEMVGKLPRGKTELDYMGHAAVTRVLIQVDPYWSWRPVQFNEAGEPLITKVGNNLRMWGYLTVLGKELLCVGTCAETKSDPEKELIGDLIRNGAMRFGVGLALWSKEEWDQAEPVPAPPVVSAAQAKQIAAVLDGIADKDQKIEAKKAFLKLFGKPSEVFAAQFDEAKKFADTWVAKQKEEAK